jgi:hypothetical protein
MSKHEVTMYGEPYCTEEDFDKVLAERDAARELLAMHNLGGHTDYIDGPIQRAMRAEAERDEHRQRAVALEDDLFVVTKQRDRLLADEQALLERVAELSDENIKLFERCDRLREALHEALEYWDDDHFDEEYPYRIEWADKARAALQEATE